MRRLVASPLVGLAAALLTLGCGSARDVDFAPDAEAEIPVSLEPVASGFGAPLGVVSPAGDPRLYAVERVGRVWRIDGGRRELALDVSEEISGGGERGLLGVAFHPAFADNGRAFVDLTDPAGDTRVIEFAGSPERARLDRGTRRDLLRVEQPEANHNGGHLTFGANGYLYIGLGDGGGGGDPRGNGQDPSTPLGAILRIDVDRGDGGRPYAIPPDNPFADGAGGAPEVYVYGLRNPWRFSIEGPDDDLWIGDVGQDGREEITRVPGSAAAGANLGWPLFEGSLRNRDGDDAGVMPPTVEYDHEVGCSVTGGVISRGAAEQALAGRYVFGDYCTGEIYAVDPDDPSGSLVELEPEDGGPIPFLRAFGTDARGELYAVAGDGVYRIASPRG